MNDNPRMFIIVSKFRKQLDKTRTELYFGKNYTVIRLEYAYKTALKYGVNNNQETKQFE